MLTVIVSVLFPYVREYFTPNVFLHLAIASLGLFWIVRDASTLLESTTRSGLNLVLDNIVVDDVLRAIYNPIDGLWACLVGTYLGASSMYGLNMSKGQRTELVQSSLGLTDESQARSVLLEPGGCKRLFPIEVQNWLHNSQNCGKTSARLAAEPTDIMDSSSSWSGVLNDKSTCDSDILLDIDSQDTILSDESSSEPDEEQKTSHHDKLPSFEDERIDRSSEAKPWEKQRGDTEWMDQADPVSVFFRILQDMARKKLKNYAERLPRSNIETIGITAVAAFGIQLALLRSSKKSRLLAKLCAGIATLSFGTVLSREAVLGNVYDKETLQMFGRDLATRILDKIREKSASYKSLLAMLVLIILSRRRQVSKGVYAKNDFVGH